MQVISEITNKFNFQVNILNDTIAGLLLWHLLLLIILFFMFYDSHHGFGKTIGIIQRSFCWFRNKNERNQINYTISKYKEKSKRVYMGNAIAALAVVVVIMLIIYLKFIFFTVVISDSMNPTLEKGDLVLVQKIIVEPKVGDIITFKVPEIELPITHRIASISGNEIRVKGDANPNEDSWRITNKNIIGKIVFISEKPAIIRGVGKYFLLDASQVGKTYGLEFNAISNLMKGIKFSGAIIFWICIILYLSFSIRDSRRMKL